MVQPSPSVELFWWRECPSWERALRMVREEMAAQGLDPETVAVIEVATADDAEREEFVGSPTIRVAGRDVQPPGEQPAGLTCRVYRRRDGSVSPLPDPADIRDALAAALNGSEDEPA